MTSANIMSAGRRTSPKVHLRFGRVFLRVYRFINQNGPGYQKRVDRIAIT